MGEVNHLPFRVFPRYWVPERSSSSHPLSFLRLRLWVPGFLHEGFLDEVRCHGQDYQPRRRRRHLHLLRRVGARHLLQAPTAAHYKARESEGAAQSWPSSVKSEVVGAACQIRPSASLCREIHRACGGSGRHRSDSAMEGRTFHRYCGKATRRHGWSAFREERLQLCQWTQDQGLGARRIRIMSCMPAGLASCRRASRSWRVSRSCAAVLEGTASAGGAVGKCARFILAGGCCICR